MAPSLVEVPEGHQVEVEALEVMDQVTEDLVLGEGVVNDSSRQVLLLKPSIL